MAQGEEFMVYGSGFIVRTVLGGAGVGKEEGRDEVAV